MSQDAELGLRDRLARLSGVKLLRGTKLSAELERLERQIARLHERMERLEAKLDQVIARKQEL